LTRAAFSRGVGFFGFWLLLARHGGDADRTAPAREFEGVRHAQIATKK
jgi:hypothetical protein